MLPIEFVDYQALQAFDNSDYSRIKQLSEEIESFFKRNDIYNHPDRDRTLFAIHELCEIVSKKSIHNSELLYTQKELDKACEESFEEGREDCETYSHEDIINEAEGEGFKDGYKKAKKDIEEFLGKQINLL